MIKNVITIETSEKLSEPLEVAAETVFYGCEHVVADTNTAYHKIDGTFGQVIVGMKINLPVEYYSCEECGVPKTISVVGV